MTGNTLSASLWVMSDCGRAVNHLMENTAAIQRHPYSLEKWASRYLLKFNKGKCKVLLLRGITHVSIQAGGWKATLQVRTWDSWWTTRSLSQQCALAAGKANSVLGCISKTEVSTAREVSDCFYSPLTTRGALCPVQQRYTRPGTRQAKGFQDDQVLRHKTDEDSLREKRLFSLANRQFEGILPLSAVT